MKTSKLKNIAWVCFALILTSSATFGQGWRNGNRVNINRNGTCLLNIQGLTEEQKVQIQEMANDHNKKMAELREQQRATYNAIEKSEIRTVMLKKVEAHRNSVKDLLTTEQQKQFEQLYATGYNSCYRQFASRNSRGMNYGRQGFGQNNRRSCVPRGKGFANNRQRFNGNNN